jgi:hypothetical protein
VKLAGEMGQPNWDVGRGRLDMSDWYSRFIHDHFLWKEKLISSCGECNDCHEDDVRKA